MRAENMKDEATGLEAGRLWFRGWRRFSRWRQRRELGGRRVGKLPSGILHFLAAYLSCLINL